MAKALVVHFDPANRPHYQHDGSTLAYFVVDFLDERVMYGIDGFDDSGVERFWLYASRNLAGRTPLSWPSTAGQTLFDLIAECFYQISDTSAGPMRVAALRINKGTKPPKSELARHHLCPPEVKDFRGTQWAAIEMPHTPDVAKDIYLDGLVVHQVLADFRTAELGLRYQQLVPGTWGNDDKCLVYSPENVRYPKDVLWDFLHLTCTGKTLLAEMEDGVTEIIGQIHGKPAMKGWPPRKILHHPERLPRAAVDDPELPQTSAYHHAVRGGLAVRVTPDGRSWVIPPDQSGRDVPGTPEELAADEKRKPDEKFVG